MKRWLKVALWSVGGVVLFVLLVVGTGLMLPEAHTAAGSRLVAGAPGEVWSVLTNVEGYPAWRTDVDAVERLPDRGGLPAWRESGANGAMTFEVTELEEPSRMVTRIADQGLPFGGRWTYELEPAGDSTRVTITEDGEIYNPIFRFVSRFVLGYEATLTRYLDGLEEHMLGNP